MSIFLTFSLLENQINVFLTPLFIKALSNLSSVTTPGRSGILNSSTGNNLTSVP